MKIMDKFPHILGSRAQPTSEPECHVLDPFEIRLIAEGKLARLGDFAASARLYAADPKGDTPLHLAARTGNLALCDLFIRSGADPDALNHERQTPADVAFSEGHGLAAQLLSSLVTNSPTHEKAKEGDITPRPETGKALKAGISEHRFTPTPKQKPEATSTSAGEQIEGTIIAPPITVRSEQLSSETDQSAAAPSQIDDLDDLLAFEAEEEPERFFGESAHETVSGTFVAHISPAPVVSQDEDGDWDLDLSPASIAGEGIGTAAAVTPDHGAEHDFLKVRSRGRQSVKRVVVQTGTQLSIDPEICTTWAKETLAKGWYSLSDIESLLALCEGNGDLEELRINLQRNLEVGGFDEVELTSGHIVGLWDARTDTSSNELAEAIEAALTRSTRLPGTQRFVMDKSDEQQLLEPMVRAKQELQLGILASEAAVQSILEVFDTIQGGVRDPSSVSLKTIIPSRPGHTETAEVMAAAEALKSWQENGRVMDGKRRRQALTALESLDLSLAFLKELVSSIEQNQAGPEHVNKLNTQISVFESANEHLVREHLPYARRFAARSVEEGEDPEDVFQVAFMGLQRSTRRFDPEHGYRFVVYASYWIRQAIMRWRADEGATIRIPVHRKEAIARLDRAMDKLDVRADGTVSDDDLAADLEWTTDEVSRFREFPREAVYPESIDDWDELLPEQDDANAFNQAETESIITDALAELPEREADVIRMRFGIGRDADMTLEKIGQLYGVTRERIRQIEAKGLDRLSHPGRKRRLQELLGI